MDNLIPFIQESFERQQDVSIKVKGTSMRPFYVDGKTEVTLSPFVGELKKLRVYLYKVNDQYLLHRYIKTKDNLHYFRGDALSTYEVVDTEDVLGVVTKMKYRGEVVACNDLRYRNNLRYYLFKKSIKLLIRSMIKGT